MSNLSINSYLLFEKIEKEIWLFLEKLRKNDAPGRYITCINGCTQYGRQLELGASCFALKIFHTFGWWETLSDSDQTEWSRYIKSFANHQMNETQLQLDGAFIDRKLFDYLSTPSFSLFVSKARSTSFRELMRKQNLMVENKWAKDAVIAETKQALAALADVGIPTTCKFNGFPRAASLVNQQLLSYDWSMPWSAGGKAACLAVFVSILEEDLGARKVGQVAMCNFFESIVDPCSGAYFVGTRPKQQMLVNGAMKVLTALDWLDTPIHYPEKLIETVLNSEPRAEGCDLLDAVYVLFKCSQISDHRNDDLRAYLLRCLEIILTHKQEDGGFSYFSNKAQKWYYGVPISKGLREGDIHGTVLFTWAIAMIAKVILPSKLNWNVIRP